MHRANRGRRAFGGFAWLLAVLLWPAAGPAAAQPLYKDSPVLTDAVATGALPPVGERLPRTPLLVQPVEKIGGYGGTWRMGMIGDGDGLLVYRTVGYEHLVRWDPAWRRVVPNIAQSFEVNADATEFTFRLRPGMRWSDGHPFTADDVLFWYEDVLLDPELTPRHMGWMASGGETGRVTAPDPHTVRFTFKAPNSTFLSRLASAYDTKGPTDFPRHALARFHPRHNPDGIAGEIAAAGVANAAELFRLKAHIDHYVSSTAALLRRPVPPGAARVAAEPVPTLAAWVMDHWEDGAPPRFVLRRNPYYWKIDPGGQQLPYIDEVVVQHVQSPAELRRLVEAGRIDMQARNIPASVPRDALPGLLAAGGYRTFETLSAENNTLALGFNLTHRDPAKRTLFGQHGFRVALSAAIDRKAIIDTVFGGKGEPYQPAPRPESRFYHERLARQHLAYDPAAANAALDALGLAERDAEGFRRRPDGERLGFEILVRRDRANFVKVAERVAADWRAVGIDARVAARDRGAVNQAREAIAFDVTIAAPDGGIDPVIEPQDYLPMTDDSVFGLAWVHWLEGRDSGLGEPPPEPVQRQIDLYRRIRQTMDAEEQARLMRGILDIAAEEFLLIGVSLPPPAYGVVREEFRNVPSFMVDAWIYPTPGPTNPFQYFFAAR
ncbi:ABC transporter substrate-binding protein [Azospirillum sp. ST 5-10]|uniref:ABC transporter substrate-binding protein n=1 Tax=unclassified Azospirillum TaxID=2630922 RepID=UPI003F49F94C